MAFANKTRSPRVAQRSLLMDGARTCGRQQRRRKEAPLARHAAAAPDAAPFSSATCQICRRRGAHCACKAVRSMGRNGVHRRPTSSGGGSSRLFEPAQRRPPRRVPRSQLTYMSRGEKRQEAGRASGSGLAQGRPTCCAQPQRSPLSDRNPVANVARDAEERHDNGRCLRPTRC